ncbi:hypothetical protein HZS_1957 [Henneguya salminicola]|nr:hypothetical protein HZS_1957 [Henneguya salminicola]
MNSNNRSSNIRTDVSILQTPKRQVFGEIANKPRDLIKNIDSIKFSHVTKNNFRSPISSFKLIDYDTQEPEMMGPHIDESDINLIGCLPGYQKLAENPSIWMNYMDSLFPENKKYSHRIHTYPITLEDHQKTDLITLQELPPVDFEHNFI